MIVACGMEDDGGNFKIEDGYNAHKNICEHEGLVAMSEFEWVNRVFVRSPIIFD